jgi:DNA-binding transcriptional LysR family regulator
VNQLLAMKVLVNVAEASSLSAAARRIGLPLATVSRRIAELEAHLGVRLFNRTSRRLELTEAGRGYLPAAKRILEDVAEAERAVKGEYAAPRGDLIVTAPLVFGRLHVLPVVVEFLAAFQDVDVRLLLNDRNVDLIADHIDLAVRIGELPDSSMVAIGVGAIGRVVCGSPGYFAKRGRPSTPDDLAGHDCVTFESLMPQASWSFVRGKADIVAQIRPRLAVNTAEAAIDAAIAGVGLTRVLAYQAAAALADGRLAMVLREFQPPPAPVSLVHPGGRLLPRKVRAFLDLAAPRLRAAIAGLPA